MYCWTKITAEDVLLVKKRYVEIMACYVQTLCDLTYYVVDGLYWMSDVTICIMAPFK